MAKDSQQPAQRCSVQYLSNSVAPCQQMNTVTILLPNAGHMKLRVNEKTLVKDLLPQIANKHRLR